MRQRPWILVILAFFHILAPVGNIIFNAIITNKNVLNYLGVIFNPHYLSRNWINVVAPIVAGVAIYACKKWSFYVYILSISILFVVSYLGYLSKAQSMSVAPVIAVYLMNLLVVTYFLIPAVRNIYFDRRMRWWDKKPRYNCDFNGNWNFEDDSIIHPGSVSNISINGLFLKSEIMPRDQDMIELRIPFDEAICLFTGQVIFHGRVNAIGFGVEFTHTKESKEFARNITNHLESQGMRTANLEVRPEDSLSFWIRTLVTTGKGLVPKK